MAIYYDGFYYPRKTFQRSVSLFAQPPAWMGAFVSPSVLAVFELIHVPPQHKNDPTALPGMRRGCAPGTQSVQGCFPPCGINRALTGNGRVTMTHSACITLLKGIKFKPGLTSQAQCDSTQSRGIKWHCCSCVGWEGSGKCCWSHRLCILHAMLKKRRETLCEDGS